MGLEAVRLQDLGEKLQGTAFLRCHGGAADQGLGEGDGITGIEGEGGHMPWLPCHAPWIKVHVIS
jgi:hypothetical protein